MRLLNTILTWNTGRLWVSSEKTHFTINICPLLSTNCVSPCENQTGIAEVMIISHRTPSDLQELTRLIYSMLYILSPSFLTAMRSLRCGRRCSLSDERQREICLMTSAPVCRRRRDKSPRSCIEPFVLIDSERTHLLVIKDYTILQLFTHKSTHEIAERPRLEDVIGRCERNACNWGESLKRATKIPPLIVLTEYHKQ